MAVLTPGSLTLAEQMKQIGPQGNLLDVVNVLAQYNEIDIDAPYIMANDRFTDVSSKVISLPTIGNRRINRGSAGGVGKTAQHREFIEIMEARPFIDSLLLDSEPDGGIQARLNQIGIFVEAMAQAKAEAVEMAVSAGAVRETVEIIEVEDIPLAYYAGKTSRVKIKAAGDLAG